MSEPSPPPPPLSDVFISSKGRPITRDEGYRRLAHNSKVRRDWAIRVFLGTLQAKFPGDDWRELQVRAAHAADVVGEIMARKHPDGELAEHYSAAEFKALIGRLNLDHAYEVLLAALVVVDARSPSAPSRG